MRYLLILLIVVFLAGDVLSLDMSLGPGLSIKNAMIYVIGLCLAFQMVTRSGYKVEVRALNTYFIVMVAYAILTWLLAGLVIRYQSYDMIYSGILLKNLLLDHILVFLLFFYGARTAEDSKAVIKALIIGLTIANALAIGNFEGFFKFGAVVVGTQGAEKGRLFGSFGHANDTAALTICLLPAYAAAALSRRNLMSLVLLAGALVSMVMLVMTESRGAYVGIMLGYGWALYACRKYVSVRKVVSWSAVIGVLLVVALALSGSHFVDSLNDRLFEQSNASDLSQVSSGRSEIWAGVVGRMMSTPISLITGFGWNAYSTMGFYYVTHNHYLWLWFELGLVGLLSFILICGKLFSMARAALDVASEDTRAYLMAFIWGFAAFLVAIFFTLVYNSWPYVYAYAGVALRLAVNALSAPVVAPQAHSAVVKSPSRIEAY